jgi:hypothetical protein
MPLFGVRNESRTRKFPHGFIWAAAVLAACLCPTLVFGQTKSTWTGPAYGDWSTASNWTPNTVPNNSGGNTYNVTIGPDTNTVILDEDVTIASLTLGAELIDESGAGSTVTGSVTLTAITGVSAGEIDLENSSQLVVDGNFTNSGDVLPGYNNQEGNDLTVAGTFINNPDALLFVGFGYNTVTIGNLINKGNIDLLQCWGCPTLVLVHNGTLTNSGTISLAAPSTDATDIGGSVQFGKLSLTGNGMVTMSSGLVSGESLTNVNNTITGSGNIELGTLTNKGTINGNDSTVPLIIQSTNGTVNTGTLEATSGGSLMLDGNTFKNTGGKIEATGMGSMVLLESGAILTGGTLSTATGGMIETPTGQTATLNGVTNSGAYVMADNSTTTLSGKITNNGTISLKSTGDQTVAMILPGGLTLVGSGMLTLGTGGPNIIEGSNGKEFLTNSSTIEGTGTISNMGLINNGTILANAGTLAIAPTVQLYGFTNNGSLIVDSRSGVNITGPVKLSFQTTGTVMISSGATLNVAGNSAYTQTKGTTTVDGNLSAANGIFISGGILNGNGGTLTGNLSLAGAALSPGDGVNKVGKLTVSGAYSQTSTSFLDIDLGGAKSGTFDVLNITGSASLHGTLNVDALTGFTPTVGEQFDILNYGSETGSFSTVACTFSNGDGCSISYNGTDAVLTITAHAVSAKTTVSGTPATRVSRNMGATASTATHEPVAILSRVTCFGARILMASCGSERLAIVAGGGERHATATAGIKSGTGHNNIMAATRAISVARGGASHESSASTTAMARLYVCAYIPSTVARTMGCN